MFDLEQFESEGRENGARYWLAHDFARRLGYESYQTFRPALLRAISTCTQLEIDPDTVFIPDSLPDGSKTYRLTRFACFLAAMQADSKKPEVARAQVALAAVAEALVSERLEQSGILRLDERSKLTQAEKLLGGAAKEAGLQPGEYGIFKDAGFRGMYNMPLQKLQAFKGAPAGKTLYDFMGLTELAANTFRVTQTAERMKNNDIKGLPASTRTAETVGREVRQVMLRSSGVAPEHLPLERPIGDVRRQIKLANRKMVKRDKKS